MIRILIIITCVAILYHFGILQAVLTLFGALLMGVAALINMIAGMII